MLFNISDFSNTNAFLFDDPFRSIFHRYCGPRNFCYQSTFGNQLDEWQIALTLLFRESSVSNQIYKPGSARVPYAAVREDPQAQPGSLVSDPRLPRTSTNSRRGWIFYRHRTVSQHGLDTRTVCSRKAILGRSTRMHRGNK